jgi:hypothetical protein
MPAQRGAQGHQLATNRRRPEAKSEVTGQPPSLLVLAQPSPETDDLLETLVGRSDLALLRVTNLSAAAIALRDVAVRLVLICSESEAATITAVLEKVEQLRPGTPVLALRRRSAEPLPAWKGRPIGLLYGPILPEVLSRTVDVALGLGTRSAGSKSR